jgi:hypothetical protein
MGGFNTELTDGEQADMATEALAASDQRVRATETPTQDEEQSD